MIGHGQARPWRVTVDSPYAAPHLGSTSTRRTHFEAGSGHGRRTLSGRARTDDGLSLLATPSPRGRPGIESP